MVEVLLALNTFRLQCANLARLVRESVLPVSRCPTLRAGHRQTHCFQPRECCRYGGPEARRTLALSGRLYLARWKALKLGCFQEKCERAKGKVSCPTEA